MASLATGISDAGVHQNAAATRGRMYSILVRLLTFPDAPLQRMIESGELDRLVHQVLTELPYPVSCAVEFDRGHTDDATTLEEDFMRLFELPVGGQPCALYGGVHAGNRQTVMEELLRYYRHFGLSVARAPEKDLPDSIPTVLEFMQFLCLLESNAASPGEAYTPRMAQKDVLSRHLVCWAPRLCKQIMSKKPSRVYENALTLMNEFCSAELEQLRG